MTTTQLIIRADFLLEALPYIQRYRGETFVVKYGGSFMDAKDPEQRDSVARDITFLEAVGINPVVVHGGGKAITRALKESGIETRFVQGMRITDKQTMNIAERVLSYDINPRIVETIQRFGGKAKGFSGSKLFKASKNASTTLSAELILCSLPCTFSPIRFVFLPLEKNIFVAVEKNLRLSSLKKRGKVSTFSNYLFT